MSATARADTHFVRQPHLGERLETGVGIVVVLAVARHGECITVHDAIDRIWNLERTHVGWWTRAEPLTHEQASRRLAQAEQALHDAHASHVDSWIAAACKQLHRAVLEYEHANNPERKRS
jgi:hypothetical protein